MPHDEGASTEVTGMVVFSSASITVSNGSRTSPWKLKPGGPVSQPPMQVLAPYTQCPHTEYSVNDVVSILQSSGEIFHKWKIQILQLRRKALSDFCQPIY
jgi:hypothetical protein